LTLDVEGDRARTDCLDRRLDEERGGVDLPTSVSSSSSIVPFRIETSVVTTAPDMTLLTRTGVPGDRFP
jgi:hypothetical protein